MSQLENQRFRAIRALYGENGFKCLQQASVMVIGVGGVGSWLAESLCRTAIGHLVLIDSDTIEVHNSNRQLHATSATIDQYKVEVLKQRFEQINPQIKVDIIKQRLNMDNIDVLLNNCPPFVCECIDDIEAKAYICNYLFKQHKTFICCGGAGGRLDPQRLALADLAAAKGDALIARLRALLRRKYGFAKGGKRMDIMCTYSDEKPIYASKAGFLSGDLPAFGTSMAVTASAGLLAASWILKQILKDKNLR